MGKILSGREIADFIKERQAKEAYKKNLSLAILRDNRDAIIEKYVRLKQEYGADINIKVEDFVVDDLLGKLQNIGDFTGAIVQLPLAKGDVDKVIKAIAREKDVDGLRADSPFKSATAIAINWLLAGHNIDLKKHSIAIVGAGRLVGAPLAKMWRSSGLEVTVFRNGDDLTKLVDYSLIVSATGVAGIIQSEYLAKGAVAIDAGTTSEEGEILGDFSEEVYSRKDLTLTPKFGGVGPLTITALFSNLLIAGQD